MDWSLRVYLTLIKLRYNKLLIVTMSLINLRLLFKIILFYWQLRYWIIYQLIYSHFIEIPS